MYLPDAFQKMSVELPSALAEWEEVKEKVYAWLDLNPSLHGALLELLFSFSLTNSTSLCMIKLVCITSMYR